MNYTKAKELIKNRESKKIDRNTYIVRSGENFTVELHNNPILTFYPDGSTKIDMCGWNTITTRDRINKFLTQNFRVYTDKGVLYLYDFRHPSQIDTWTNAPRYVFKDGITIGSRGGVKGAGSKSSVKKMQKLRKQALKYCKDFINELCSGKVSAPSEGDCWFCSMCQGISGNNHITDHFKDKYYVPSLFVNAIEQHPLSLVSQSTLSALWCGDNYPQDQEEFVMEVRNNTPSNDHSEENWFVSMLKDQGLSSLKRYVYQQLNLTR